MQALQPLSLIHAIGLAEIQEEKYLDIRQFSAFQQFSSIAIAPLASISTSPSTQPPFLLNPDQHIPIKKLTPAELQHRHDKGLCYTCDGKFIPGHNAKHVSFCSFQMTVITIPCHLNYSTKPQTVSYHHLYTQPTWFILRIPTKNCQYHKSVYTQC